MDDRALLQFELQDLNDHIRTLAQTYFQWFTFFLTLLLATMGWTLNAAVSESGEVVAPVPFYAMVFLFSIQLIQSIKASGAVREDIDSARRRAKEILALLKVDTVVKTSIPPSYSIALRQTTITLRVNFWLWICIAALVLCAQLKGFPLAVQQ